MFGNLDTSSGSVSVSCVVLRVPRFWTGSHPRDPRSVPASLCSVSFGMSVFAPGAHVWEMLGGCHSYPSPSIGQRLTSDLGSRGWWPEDSGGFRSPPRPVPGLPRWPSWILPPPSAPHAVLPGGVPILMPVLLDEFVVHGLRAVPTLPPIPVPGPRAGSRPLAPPGPVPGPPRWKVGIRVKSGDII